jgi:prevent-host-death family protein
METINAARFKATCLALLDRVERTGQPIRVTKRGKPVAQISPVAPVGKRRIMGCMEGTAKIVGDIESPVVRAHNWEVLRS